MKQEQQHLDTILSYLITEQQYLQASPVTYPQKRKLVRDLLTARKDPRPLPKHILSGIDSLLSAELSEKPIIDSESLDRCCKRPQHLLNKISVWKGDITTLGCDAIVNAANNQMLGCFAPSHRCIDNVIHAAAGPRLRSCCQALMEKQGWSLEPNGRCKVTPAFNLPSRFILHTVGPALTPSQKDPTNQQVEELVSCYRSCLDAAHNMGDITSVAFCCISTGLFRFPEKLAATLASQTVMAWLAAHPSSAVRHVIFNVFSDQNFDHYTKALEQHQI